LYTSLVTSSGRSVCGPVPMFDMVKNGDGAKAGGENAITIRPPPEPAWDGGTVCVTSVPIAAGVSEGFTSDGDAPDAIGGEGDTGGVVVHAKSSARNRTPHRNERNCDPSYLTVQWGKMQADAMPTVDGSREEFAWRRAGRASCEDADPAFRAAGRAEKIIVGGGRGPGNRMA
jgi:hypothetical protein